MENLYETISTFTPDNLIAGHNVPILPRGIVLAKNQGVIQRGTVIGIVTATKLAVPVDSTKTDGSQTPFGITTDTVDTGSGAATQDTKTTAYTSGLFNSKALRFGGTDNVSKHETKLRELGIYLQENNSY
ncbi:head decoration protein [Niallia taxi]|uniref:head decoration protein n=1 Tax=Niallia taxi TaxID=2499688 RepID=UPI003981B195